MRSSKGVSSALCVCITSPTNGPLTKHFISTSLFLTGNSGGLTRVKHSSRESSAIHAFLSVCAVVPCVQNTVDVAANVWVPVLMRAIAQRVVGRP